MKKWYENGTDSTNTLYHAFKDGLVNSVTAVSPLFNDIYVPYVKTTSTGTATAPIYVNIGYGADDIAQLYRDQYGLNYLITPYTDIDSSTNKSADLTRRINSVVQANIYKYLKNIELIGYYYNPLWNVDGSEIYSYADFGHYDETDVTHTINSPGLISERQVTTYDSTSTRKLDETTDSGSTDDNYTVTRVRTLDQAGTRVDSADDAFGNTLSDAPDNYHVEKKVRQGNIGVVSTMEMVTKQRELLKYSIINDFFTDLNKQILVGIY